MMPRVERHPVVQHATNLDAMFPNGHYDYSYGARRDFFAIPGDAATLGRSYMGRQAAFLPPADQSRLGSHSGSSTRRSNGVPGVPEHLLRRKTPSGTIDAGYDGSPAQMDAGPPPLKQVVVPAPSPMPMYTRASPAALLPLFPIHLSPGQGADTAWSLSDAMMPVEVATPRSPPLYAGAAVPESHYLGGHLQEMPGLFRTAYQPYLKHASLNGAAVFESPPVVELKDGVRVHVADNYSAGQVYAGQAMKVAGAYVPAQAFPMGMGNIGPTMMAPTPLGYLGPSALHNPSMQLGATGFPNAATQPVNLNLDALSLGPGVQGRNKAAKQVESSSRSRFREKVLAQAHQAYVELLAYHHYSRKLHAVKGAYGSGEGSTTSKLAVYPKPPRPFLGGTATSGAGGLPASRGSDSIRGSPSRAGGGLSRQGFAQQQGFMGGMTSLTSLQQLTHSHPPVSVSRFDVDKKSPTASAQATLEMLCHLCEQSGWKWMDGMLLGGCLHYGLEHYEKALEWFSRIIDLDSSHVEAVSNKAATLYCLGRRQDAEQQWLQVIRSRPQYLEAVEHLVGLLYKKRSKEAVDVINFVQSSLRLPDAGEAGRSRVSRVPDGSRGHGSSGYAIPGCENGRILALVHAKGTMLYGLKDIQGASRAFEEAVLISTDRQIGCVQNLVRRIQDVLAPLAGLSERTTAASHPLLLTPQDAKRTAGLMFSRAGELPGLRYVPDGSAKKAAMQTTSNSLLSLAKIFQDAMSNGAGSCGAVGRQPSGVGDILALYYLSLSLQESPSTANNVGILLASVQHSSAPQLPQHGQHGLERRPGPVPMGTDSGLMLAFAYYNYGLMLDPKHVHLHTNLGSLLKDLGQLDKAIQMYEQAVACDATFDIALTNLANAVKDRGRISDAIMYYKRAVNSNPDFAEAVCGLSTALNSVCDWRGRGGVYLDGGKFDRWHVNEDGMLHDSREAKHEGGLVKRVVDIVRRQLDDSCNWGRGILHDESVFTAVASHLKTLAHDGARVPGASRDMETELKKWANGRWEGARLVRLIERATRFAMWRWYRERFEEAQDKSNNKNARSRLSRLGYPRLRIPTSLAVPSAPTVLPFHTFTCPLAASDIRMISQRNALRISCSTLRSPWLPASVYPPPAPPQPHLNIGYVSSDFNNHPLAHLMQSVFGFHNPSRAKAFCYATTASDRSVHRQQIEREAPVFRDVSNWSPDALVKQIVQDGIHILVNLNGYTRGARNEIFAARPAPIQMSFMGFAGTLGAEWCDYVLADSTAIPRETLRPWRGNRGPSDIFCDGNEVEDGDWVYSENVIFCRDTFFCCDHAQSANASERRVTWVEEQGRRWKMRKDLFPNLPDDAIILGNFNQLYKLDPTTFRTWLRILARVPKAVLWLLRFPELGESNLRRTAAAWAGEQVSSRIIFTDVAPKNQHITRARICDLFLDTPECNAHTTAADVLWSSTPLLTLPRYPYKMCSRMAASILRGALPKTPEGESVAAELVASSEEDYERTAIELAGGLSYLSGPDGQGLAQGRLADMRRLLHTSKWTCALFDTRRWVKDLEMAYEEAWRRWVSGEGGDIYL